MDAGGGHERTDALRADTDRLTDECKEKKERKKRKKKKNSLDADGKWMGCVQTRCMCVLMRMDAGGGGGGGE